jgi:hypothetical protein
MKYLLAIGSSFCASSGKGNDAFGTCHDAQPHAASCKQPSSGASNHNTKTKAVQTLHCASYLLITIIVMPGTCAFLKSMRIHFTYLGNTS